MSASYKPALLKALVRIVRDAPADRVDLLTIGNQFVRLYWVQTVVFRLRQAATLNKEPEVVRTIRHTADAHHVRRLSDLPDSVRAKLARDMARILKIDVLRRFHNGKPPSMPLLFSWEGGDSITLTQEALAFVQREAPVLEALSNLWWARFLERVNLLAPLVIEKVERDGAERSSLARYLRLLQEIDAQECFYCGSDLRGGTVHVDHVIPWSFLLTDPPWDLVMACSACNLAKSDVLPDRSFLEKLARVHDRRAKLTMPSGFSACFLPPEELLRFYDAAISVEWPAGWTPQLS